MWYVLFCMLSLTIHSDEKAVYFIQAEKMYYETALIDILQFQQEVGKKSVWNYSQAC